jgi:hypothetical protein
MMPANRRKFWKDLLVSDESLDLIEDEDDPYEE